MWTTISGLLLLLSSYNIVIIHGSTVLPSIDFQDPPVKYENVKNKADKIGAFEVKNLGQSYHESMQKFFRDAPACLQQNPTLPKMKQFVNCQLRSLGYRMTFTLRNSYMICLTLSLVSNK